MQCIISALKSESQPIIDSFGLKRNNSFPFPVYQNQNISQLIVGVGKKNVEQRISSFFDYYKSKNMYFINIGIAGGGKANSKIGELYLINKIIDKQTKKHFFPDILANSTIDEHSITTVNQSVSNGAGSYTTLVDMEASAIYQACMKRVATHQISFLKIVSDYMDEDMFALNKRMIQSLVMNKIEVIRTYIEKQNNIQKSKKSILTNEDEDWINSTKILLNLSETQFYKVNSLFKGYRLKNSYKKFEKNIFDKPKSKKERNQLFKKICEKLSA
jgi:nucleoside phosphorylase